MLWSDVALLRSTTNRSNIVPAPTLNDDCNPITVADTCAASVREWYHIQSPGENTLSLKKGHDTLCTGFGERISQNTQR